MQAPKNIAVAGATGRVGRHLVDVLTERGHDVVPISRTHGVDLVTAEGLDAALQGVEVVIDAATGPESDEDAATKFFTASAANLIDHGQRAGVRRIIPISIIGTDRSAAGYGVGKLVQEQALSAGPIPVTVVRAAQFHEFVDQLVGWGTQGEVAYVPNMRTQLVAARFVADAIADIVSSDDASQMVEVAGPREESLVDAAALLVAHRGEPLKVEGVSNPDDPNTVGYESGWLLPGPDAVLGGPTFEQWLEDQT